MHKRIRIGTKVQPPAPWPMSNSSTEFIKIRFYFSNTAEEKIDWPKNATSFVASLRRR